MRRDSESSKLKIPTVAIVKTSKWIKDSVSYSLNSCILHRSYARNIYNGIDPIQKLLRFRPIPAVLLGTRQLGSRTVPPRRIEGKAVQRRNRARAAAQEHKKSRNKRTGQPMATYKAAPAAAGEHDSHLDVAFPRLWALPIPSTTAVSISPRFIA